MMHLNAKTRVDLLGHLYDLREAKPASGWASSSCGHTGDAEAPPAKHPRQ